MSSQKHASPPCDIVVKDITSMLICTISNTGMVIVLLVCCSVARQHILDRQLHMVYHCSTYWTYYNTHQVHLKLCRFTTIRLEHCTLLQMAHSLVRQAGLARSLIRQVILAFCPGHEMQHRCNDCCDDIFSRCLYNLHFVILHTLQRLSVAAISDMQRPKIILSSYRLRLRRSAIQIMVAEQSYTVRLLSCVLLLLVTVVQHLQHSRSCFCTCICRTRLHTYKIYFEVKWLSCIVNLAVFTKT